ncbi:MAG TPA: hypothetical protein VMW73_06625 [Spirochaetia bacterium]|nr:hypothetical protein [Spirochaetia bacterium]
MARRTLAIAFLFTLVASVAFGQVYSTKKEIAVFRLGYYSWRIPQSALSAIDSQIQNVFVNLGRFTVIGYAQSIEAQDVSQFIDTLRRYKEKSAGLPEQVQLGRVAFTRADLDHLTGSFVVVVPAVSYFNMDRADDGDFIAAIDTSFAFVNVQDLTTMAQFTVSTSGRGTDRQDAIRAATDGIPLQLSYEIRKIPAFQIKTGIIDFSGGDVVMEFGRNMGVKAGDEYSVVTPKIFAGHQVDESSGVLIVKEVHAEYSIAHVLYADRRLYVGDQLVEIPRIGLEASFYSDLIAGQSSYGSSSALSAFPLLGVRFTLTRGTYRVRPTVEIEVPLRQAMYGGFPTNLFLGIEMFNIYAGRVQLAPTALFGGGGYYFDNNFYLTHAGGKAQLDVSLLLNKDMKLSFEGGYTVMLGLLNDPYFWAASYWGPFGGIGITAKF